MPLTQPIIAQQYLSMLQSRFGVSNLNTYEVIRWCFYDYIYYPTLGGATSPLNFFSIPLGNNDPNGPTGNSKTYEDTNLTQAGSLGNWYYIIMQYRTHVAFSPKTRQPSGISDQTALYSGPMGDATAKLEELYRRGVLTFTVNSRRYQDAEQPFLTWPPGFGIEIQQNSSNRTTRQTVLAQQNNNPMNVFGSDPEIVIEPRQTFQMTLSYPDGTGPDFTTLVNSTTPRLRCGVILDGFLCRQQG